MQRPVDGAHSRMNSMSKSPRNILNDVGFRILDKSVTSMDGFQLPTIGKPTDFKGFLDTSIVF